MKRLFAALALVATSPSFATPAQKSKAPPSLAGYDFRNVNQGKDIKYPNLSPDKFYAIFKNASSHYIVLDCAAIPAQISHFDIAGYMDDFQKLKDAEMNCPTTLAAAP